jgi:hypothetical protein
MIRLSRTLAVLVAAGVFAHAGEAGARERSGRAIYDAACATCHGRDGRGIAAEAADYPLPRPDFTDCSFATREPDVDWLAVSHDGGPARGFSRLMPAYGDALTRGELERALHHVRSFCTDTSWPRGELNLPRALVTEKAFPEDEAVLTLAATDDGVTSRVVYERRIGAQRQVELVVPLALAEREEGDWTGGIGDVALAFKQVLSHSVTRGRILSAAAEVVLPTGSTERRIGGGSTMLEPFLTFGQILPAGGFLQAQVGGGLSVDRRAADELFWRAAAGREFTRGEFGRAWSPMLEILGSRDLESGAHTRWDLVPQLQVTLNRRQHIMANAGVRLPINERAGRSPQFLMYVLWDWFDGGLRDGW